MDEPEPENNNSALEGSHETECGEPVYFDDLKPSGLVREEAEQDGGEIPGGPPGVTSEPRGKIRDRIAIRLLWLLGLLIVLHHSILCYLVCVGRADVKTLETAFNSVLPVLAGLLGTAVAFYFKE